MGAHIRITLRTSSTGPIVPPVTTDQSRNDLRKGYYVTAESVDAATTYSWQLAFAPQSSGPDAIEPDAYTREPSTASLSSTTAKTVTFTVDFEGSYLLRLVVDAGLPTEEVIFVRLRVMTKFAELFLIAAGERRDESGVIPVDVDPQGWANEQNSNIQRLMLLVRRASMSGRVLYVDANRGRDNMGTTPPNDPSVIVRMPGTDNSNLDETGMRIAAQGFGDFSSINDAIAYASDCVSRGEAPLGPFNPYLIKISPGFYQEDLALVPHVHLIADISVFGFPSEPDALMLPVGVSTTSNPGAHHEFTAAQQDDICVLRGIFFTNTTDTSEPIFHQRGGTLVFDRCTTLQQGADPTQGPIVLAEMGAGAPPVYPGVLFIDSFSYMQTGDPSLPAVLMTDPGVIYLRDSNLWGDTAILFNSNFADTPFGGEVRFENSWVRSMTSGGYSFRGLPGNFVCLDSEFDNEDALSAPILAFELVDTSGVLALPNAVNYEVTLDINTSDVLGDISTRTNQTTADVNLHPSSLRVGGEYLFPTGAPTEWEPRTNSTSVLYNNAYVDPLEPVGPLPTTLPTNKVQNAIDMLVGGTFPDGPGAPYYSLDSAYDGAADLQPFTRGAGLGREITADEGAVKIGGAEYPGVSWLTDRVLTGGLQAEGNVDIGPVVDGGTPNGALDNLGSEINFRPGVFAGAAMMSMGRTVNPDGFNNDHRGFPGGVIMGGNPNAANAANGHVPFNLHLRTRNNYDSDTNELGRIVIGGGESYPDFGSIGAPGTKGGSVYVQGGTCYQPTGVPPYSDEAGTIFLAPGMTTDLIGNSTPSKIRICLLNSSVTRAELVAGNTFVPGGEGIFWLSGLNGMEQFEVSATDALIDVMNTINTTSYQFVASDAGGGVLQVNSITPGPNGDVAFSGCDPLTLNANHLRDLDVGSGAVFTPGVYGDFVDISCTGAGALEVDGDFNVTGTITQAGVPCCGGGGGGGPTLVKQSIILPPLPVPTPINATARLVDVYNPLLAPGHILDLPAAPPDGREVTIKDATQTAGVLPYTIQTIDGTFIETVGNTSFVTTGNGQAFRLMFSNTVAPGYWFIL